MSETQVLIIGAGPTGLVLAMWLARLGVRVRIVDKTAEPGTTTRALVVHARTLEFYRQFWLADELVRQGRKFVAANLWVKGRQAGRAASSLIGMPLLVEVGIMRRAIGRGEHRGGCHAAL